MSSVWWLIAIIGLIVWLVSRSKSKTNVDEVDINSKSYAQGYWDGYRAHKKKVSGVSASDTDFVPPKINSDGEKTLGQLERLEGRLEQLDEPVEDNSEPEQPIEPSYSMSETVKTPDVVIDYAAVKAKHDSQNINTTLYVASFLLVAAVALFVGTSLPDAVKFMGVWFITVAFYAAGLILHATIEKLRPAAIAFVGTGLAILPFTGIAMYNFVLHDGPACWLITSIIGLVAFVFAAMRLKSQVVAFMAIAFGVSLSTSSVAVLDVGLIWYFVALIIFGCVMTFISKLKIKLVPDYFSKPINDSSNWIVPLTIVASLFAFNGMTVGDYWVISLVSAFYYGAVAVSTIEGREGSIFLTRFLASLSALLMAYDFSDSSWTAVGFALSIVGIIQVAISLLFLPKRAGGDSNNNIWLWLGFVFQLFAPLFVLHEISWAPAVSAQLFALLVVSFGSAYYLRRTVLSIFGTISLAILPIIWCTKVIQPELQVQWIALIFLIIAAVVLSIRSVRGLIDKSPSIRPFLLANFTLFIIEALLFTANIRPLWGFMVWSAATLMVYVLMCLERKPWISLILNAMILLSIVRFIEPKFEMHWIALIFIVLAAITLVLLLIKKVDTIWPSTHQFLIANFGLFVIEALMFTTNITPGWGFVIWTAAEVMIYILMYLERQPWLSVLANIMLSISIWRFVVPQLESFQVAIIFISFAFLVFIIRAFTKIVDILPSVRPALFANVGMFMIQALLYTSGIEFGWGLLIWLIASVLIYAMTYVEKLPWLIIIGNLMLLVSCIWMVNYLEVSEAWKIMTIAWTSFAIFYVAYWLLRLNSKRQYAVYFWWTAIISTGILTLLSLNNQNEQVVAWAGLGSVGIAAAMAYEGWRIRNYVYIDIATIVATIGLQRILYIAAPDTNFLVYTHWWSLVFAGLSYLYYSAGKKTDSKTLVYLALITLSLPTGLAALGSFGASDKIDYQLVFIIEHVLVMIAGLASSKKLYTVWGAVCAILAVLWMIRGYTYVLLAVVALVLIAAAVYALIRQSKNTK